MFTDLAVPSIAQIIRKGADYLSVEGIPNARLEAEVLLAHALAMERIQLYMRPDQIISLKDRERYQEALVKRGQNMPLAYITGSKEFYSLDLHVNENVLIPRPETELLVDWLLALFSDGKHWHLNNIVELGTGTGAVTVALAYNLLKAGHKDFRIYATDISWAALQVARENIERLQVGEVIELFEGDIYRALPESILSKVGVIVSNPPYIPSGDIGGLAPEIREYEPIGALDGGVEGLDFYGPILDEGRRFLVDGGRVLLEIGDGQGRQVMDMAAKLGYGDIELHADYGARERMVTARWR
ncbi:MAG: peptide chain release factor N(5)-glutamine methyltransferase [Firmicutes bacterium]|nr:peptide chain release factor N(5)-glutamine methyltransferase [Bacillota bacterium]